MHIMLQWYFLLQNGLCRAPQVMQTLNMQFCSIQPIAVLEMCHLNCLAKDPSHVKDAFAHQHDSMLLKRFHAKLCQVRAEGDGCPVVRCFTARDLGLTFFAHVVIEHLQPLL